MLPKHLIKTSLREIDITPLAEIYFHPRVQELAGKTQLSFVDKEFVGGRHSRLEHSLLVYHFTDELAYHLERKGMLTAQQGRNLRVAALLHDLGHPPFSHAIEIILGSLIDEDKPLSHNKMSVDYIKQSDSLQKAIEHCGADADSVCSIVEKKHHDSKIISHNTPGMDKIGYTLLDLHHTGYRFPSLPYFLDMIPFYIYDNNILGIGEAKSEAVKDLQNTIQKMYAEVYLTPEVTKYRRMIQKAVEYHVKADNLNPRALWELGEGTLLYLLGNSTSGTARELSKRFNIGEAYRCALVLKLNGFVEVRGKPDTPVIEIPIETLDKLSGIAYAPLTLTSIEDKITADMNLKAEDFFIAVSSDPKRITPEDVVLFNPEGRNQKTLFEQYPDHARSLKERAMAFFTIQVHTTPENLIKVQNKADDITNLLS